jgi:hypothetical protein
MVLQCRSNNFRMSPTLIPLQRAIALILLLLLTIKQGCICDTLYDPLQPWLWLALHSFGLV